jgi:NADH:ubiquinone oxidoreductase subunit F (NADH-binding)
MFSHHLLPEAPIGSLAEYEARGGGEALAFVADVGPEAVLDLLDAAGLRGRGGAGFPTGVKWRSVRDGGADKGERYVVANGAEGEPGTFKDRPLLRTNPYQVLEGLIVAAHTVGAHEGFVALKGSFEPEIAAVERALVELREGGWLDDLRLYVVKGPDEYLFGEEKAMLEVIEGGDPLPRLFPPYLYGLFATLPQMGWSAAPDDVGVPEGPASNPTLVNNVETYANVLPILSNGADWYRDIGDPRSPGPLIVTVTGATVRDGYAEVASGETLRDIIEVVGGGLPEGRSIKAVLSGVANPVLTADRLDVELTHEAMAAAGTGLGAAGFLVFDDTTDMVRVAHSISRFLYVESCGQCPACKFGTGEITAHLEQLIAGDEGQHAIDVIAARLRTVTDANRCFLGEQEQRVVASILQHFPEDVALHLSGVATGPVPPVAKIVDLVDGVASYDERQAFKRPDWTYADEVPVTWSKPRRVDRPADRRAP